MGLAEEFADGESVCAILGDNVFFSDISPVIRSFTNGARLFVKEVADPTRLGVVTLEGETVTSIEEKPAKPKSNLASTGCYLYDADCFDLIRKLTPSARGELEITDLSRLYMENGQLTATVVEDEWIDAGTFESLWRAAELVRKRKGPEKP